AYLSTHPSKRLHSFCFDDDDDEDYTFAITPDEPVLSTKEPDNSLSMGDDHLDTIPVTESDEFIKSSVENLIPIPRENDFFLEVDAFLAVEDEPTSSQFPKSYLDPEGDMLLLEAFLNDDHSSDFKTNNDQSCSDEDVLEKIVSKPLSEEEIIPMKSLHIRLIEKLLYDNSSLRPPEEFVSANSYAENESFSPSPILVKDLPSNNTLSFAEESFHFDIPPFSCPPAKPPDGDTGIFNIKMMGDISDQNAFMHKLMITLAPHQEKSPDILSHRGLKAFQSFAKCPIMIHGQNNPPLDVLLFIFIPLDPLKFWGIWSS
nr:hypothetical protein [Tanacetum cinerariifolium]